MDLVYDKKGRQLFHYIYLIHFEDGWGYIGQRQHHDPYNDNYRGSCQNKKFKLAIRNDLNFLKKIIKIIPHNIIKINLLEIGYSIRYRKIYGDKFYNVVDGPPFGKFSKLSGENNGNYGNKWTDEQKELLRQKKLGTKMSEDTKLKMSFQRKGKPKTKQHAENISKGLKGKNFHSELQDKLQSNRMKELLKDPRNHNMFGKKHKEESRNKMKAAWIIRRVRNSTL